MNALGALFNQVTRHLSDSRCAKMSVAGCTQAKAWPKRRAKIDDANINRRAKRSSCAARSPCRLAGIPARRSHCKPERHWGLDSSADRRHRVRPDNEGRCEAGAAAAEGAAFRARRQWALPEPSVSTAGRSARQPRLKGAKRLPPKPPKLPIFRHSSRRQPGFRHLSPRSPIAGATSTIKTDLCRQAGRRAFAAH